MHRTSFRCVAIGSTLAAVLACHSAHAGLVIDTEDRQPPAQVVVYPPAPAPLAVLTQQGEPAGVQPKVNVAAKDQVFIAAMRKIVPPTWKAFGSDPRIKEIKGVSFAGGGKPWVQVMEDVLRSVGAKAHLDWDRKEVTFSMAQPVQASR